MLRRGSFFALMLVLAFGITAAAQTFELAGLGGGQFPQSSGTATFQKSPAAQVNLAFRIAHVPLIAAYAEMPVVFGLKNDITPGTFTAIPRDYKSLYFTPGLKIKFAPISPISPFLAGGVGFARLTGSSTLVNGTTNPNPTSTKAIFDVGGGLDFKAAPFLSFRVEVRDFYAGLPNGQGLSGRQHTIIPSGGLVLRF